jgi:hypothetical protein
MKRRPFAEMNSETQTGEAGFSLPGPRRLSKAWPGYQSPPSSKVPLHWTLWDEQLFVSEEQTLLSPLAASASRDDCVVVSACRARILSMTFLLIVRLCVFEASLT